MIYLSVKLIKYKITIHRAECITCGNCYTMDELHFDSDAEGFAKVVGGIIKDEISTGQFSDDEIEDAREAEGACPVAVIKVEEI